MMSRVITLMFYQTALGSSPRVWGQDLFPPICNRLRRIIPTRVGTSYNRIRRYKKRWDHPHACGDKRSPSFVIVSIRGSSPRVWGQEISKLCHSVNQRIIPTRVGTSTVFRTIVNFPSNHPHACGDKHILLKVCNTLRGSSPRVWGQVVTPATFVVKVGIIPTRMGTRVIDNLLCTV